ncbi:uncharacterized protein LOC132273123 [Cornus florida]|uniref:uncharacterized protein LOC132273123 n=1 Tax=Cornus florida TaxID=4283 RepID=UPI00289C2CE6|nr:uncharacterized protein LOC132273123 [Cornus florida]
MKRKISSVNTLYQQSTSTQIKFNRIDLLRVQIPYEDSLVVSLTIAECLVRRVLIDPGSSVNVMPRDTFDQLEIKPERLKPTANPLLGFDGKRVEPIGWIYRVQGVPSTLHQVMRCLGPDGNKNGDEEPMDLTEEPLANVKIHYDRPERTTRVGIRFAEEEKRHLDMPGISPSVSCHSLNVNPTVKPIRQKQRRFTPERNQIIAEEVDRLLDATFISEVHYPDWVSNVVVMQRKMTNGEYVLTLPI